MEIFWTNDIHQAGCIIKDIECFVPQIGFIVFDQRIGALCKIGKEISFTFMGEFLDVITVPDDDKLTWLAVPGSRCRTGILDNFPDN
jgi:hypothetical protein